MSAPRGEDEVALALAAVDELAADLGLHLEPATVVSTAPARDALDRLQSAVQATPDVPMRLRRVARFVRETPPEELPALLDRAAAGSIDADLRTVYVALAHWVLHARPRPRFPVGHWPLPADELAPGGTEIAEAIAASMALDWPFSHIILRDAFARVQPSDSALLPLHPSVEKWPLGLRREKARGTDKNALPFLLLDTTPAVVQILAENPRVLEPQAVQIASLRSQHPWSLQGLLMSPRWLGNERVTEAVARNPSSPGWLVLLVAPLLPRRVQMALVHLQWIDRDVREVLGRWHGVAMAEQTTAPPIANIYEVTDDGLRPQDWTLDDDSDDPKTKGST